MQHFCHILQEVNVGKVAYGHNSTRKTYTNTTLHAEIDAFAKLGFKKMLNQKLDLIVIKLTKTGKFGESRPCETCVNRLVAGGANIKHVYYSTSSGKIVKENFNSMIHSKSNYVSYGIRSRMA